MEFTLYKAHAQNIFFGPILWGHSCPLCHALSLLSSSLLLLLWTSILHCHSPGVATVARHLRYSYSWLQLILVVVSTVATPGEWQCKIRTGGMRRLAVARGYAKRGICRRRVSVCVCLSHFGIVSKRLNIGSRKQRRTIAP